MNATHPKACLDENYHALAPVKTKLQRRQINIRLNYKGIWGKGALDKTRNIGQMNIRPN